MPDSWLPNLDSLRLEDELGVELFRRTTRTVNITPAGLRLQPRAWSGAAIIPATASCARCPRSCAPGR